MGHQASVPEERRIMLGRGMIRLVWKFLGIWPSVSAVANSHQKTRKNSDDRSSRPGAESDDTVQRRSEASMR